MLLSLLLVVISLPMVSLQFTLGSFKNWTIIYGIKVTPSTPLPFQVVNLDLESSTTEIITSLKSRNKTVICYFSAGTYENWRSDKNLFPANIIGSQVSGWAGERWLDIRSPVVADIMYKRVSQAYQKGCDAVDPDNVDAYTHDTGFPLTFNDQLKYNILLSTYAHSFNIRIGLKNDLDQIPFLIRHFDFAMNEQCFQYSECSALTPFIQSNKTVFNIEYSGRLSRVCPRALNNKFNTLFTNLQLTGSVRNC